MRRVLIIATCTVGVGYTAWISFPESTRRGPAPERDRDPTDLVCGARSVQFVLRQYGIEEDLIPLVREIQGPVIESGANVAALDTALRKRGIYTSVLRIGPATRVRWPHPVIVLLGGEGKLGHFVVLLPSDRPDVETVWAGLEGLQSGPSERLATRRSGEIILTAPSPIDRPESAIKLSWADILGSRLVVYAALVVLLIGLVFVGRRRALLPTAVHAPTRSVSP